LYRFFSRKYLCVVLVGVSFFAISVTQAKARSRQREASETIGKNSLLSYKRQFGTASWYGGRNRGKLTASGIRFNPDAPVAAHATLPLPTVVRVTNLSNGRSAEVFVIDRMSKKYGRVIDLSQGVARKLGFVLKGVTRVQIEVMARPPMKFVRTSLSSAAAVSQKKSKALQKKSIKKKPTP
jgi:rare lipoprotein A